MPAKEKNSPSRLPILMAAVSLLISIGGFVYMIRTYSVSHRPYLGIVSSPFQFIENPPRGITWKYIVKNTGTQPAVMKVEANTTTLTKSSRVYTFPSRGGLGDSIMYVMPEQSVELIGHYNEVDGEVKMQELLNGSAFLETNVRIS